MEESLPGSSPYSSRTHPKPRSPKTTPKNQNHIWNLWTPLWNRIWKRTANNLREAEKQGIMLTHKSIATQRTVMYHT